jgi:hypothetical protein
MVTGAVVGVVLFVVELLVLPPFVHNPQDLAQYVLIGIPNAVVPQGYEEINIAQS